jgi:polyferredoxin
MNATPPSDPRPKILRSLLRTGHRFRGIRHVMSLASIGLLVAVPLSGLARLDLWRGEHLALGKPASAVSALMALVFSAGLSYLVTYVVNFIGGRLFCGFGCPLSLLFRLSEGRKLARSRPRRVFSHLYGPIYAALFSASLVLWFVDPRVMLEGSLGARAGAIAGLAAGMALVLWMAAHIGFRFCRNWCPVGLYYSVVAPTKSFGIAFETKGCIECNACDDVCPMHLPPRDLLSMIPRREGLAVSEAPAVNHCLSCGDCVEACQMVLSKKSLAVYPLRMDWHPFAHSDQVQREVEETEDQERQPHQHDAERDGRPLVG